MIDLDAVEARAKNATPGPWETADGDFNVEASRVIQAPPDLAIDADGNPLPEPVAEYSQPAYTVCETDDAHSDGRWGTWQANARHIAGMDPPTVLAMVAELRAARLERDQLSRDASDARRQLGIAAAMVVRLDVELRAAREVVERARHLCNGAQPTPQRHAEAPWPRFQRVVAALAAYDQAVTR